MLKMVGGAAAVMLWSGVATALVPTAPIALPTGQAITPTAAGGALFQPLRVDLPGLPGHEVGQASAVALSPDGATLLILTSGYNLIFDGSAKPVANRSTETIFVYDVSGATPVLRQTLPIANTLQGIAWAPAGDRFFVAGGVDDAVAEFIHGSSGFVAGRRIALGHAAGLGLVVKPAAAGLAVSPDGRHLLVANLENDSVSLIDLASGTVTGETGLRPGKADPARAGVPGGTYPNAVVWVSDTKAYVASIRDRELIALTLRPTRMAIGRRIATRGQPSALVANRPGTRVYAAFDNSDGLGVVDTARDRLIETVPTVAPAGLITAPGRLGGAGSNALALAADGATMFVSNGAQNAVAVVALTDAAQGRHAVAGKHDADDARPTSRVVGLIPTGWYPTGVAVRADGRLFVVNAKSVPGPNPGGCRDHAGTVDYDKAACQAHNQYIWQLQKAGFLTLPRPTPVELGRLTRQVAVNNHYTTDTTSDATMAFLRGHIRHVIYVVKENRGYDQVLGDLGIGNGEPRLALLGEALTPNHHALAREFVTLDAFQDSGETSNTGWNWTTAARATDYAERNAPVNYADRGLSYDQEGGNRNINVGLAGPARIAANPLTPPDPDLLAGTADVAAPDGPDAAIGEGYIWNAALRAHKTVRNYGFYGDLTRYSPAAPAAIQIPREHDPHAAGLQVFYVDKPALLPVTDPYYRGFDQTFPDYWRFKEWEREFDGYAASGDLPALSLVRLAHDHFGNFAHAIDGVDTVETEMADNDYALGLLIAKVAGSRFAADTLVFVIEDDAQDGPDHVSARRSIAFIAGPYVRHHALVSTPYTTVSMIRTIEDVLGVAPLGLNDAMAAPMRDMFDIAQAPDWQFRPRIAAVLRTTKLPLPPLTTADASCLPSHLRSSRYWAAAMAGQNFDVEDKLDTAAFNRALRIGLAPGRTGSVCPATASATTSATMP